MKIPLYENDVILPLFTSELREHLKTKINLQIKIADEKIKADGWGKTKFGEPNREYYGDYTHHFHNYFYQFMMSI